MRALLGRCVVLIGIATALAGCGEARLASVLVKEGIPDRGVYKVGKPYQIRGVWYHPVEDYSYDETGIASWYGHDFHNKETANGELFDMNAVTAAHKTLPMPSFVRVTNLENGRAIVVRVNDRGPYVGSRIIDLSRRSAQLLGFEGKGTAKVRVEIMAEESKAIAAAMKERSGGKVASAPRPAAQPVAHVQPATYTAPAELQAQPVSQVPVTPTRIYIQAGAFSQYDNASRVGADLRQVGATAVTPTRVGEAEIYRVRMGPIDSVDEADRMLDKVINAGYPDARVVVD